MKQFKLLAIFLILVSIISCNKESDEATGIGDVLVVAKRSGTNTVYGISIYAYTFSQFQSVKVTSSAESGKTYNLQSHQGYKTNFYYETPEAQFSATKPAASTYNFTSVFENGATDEFQDVLTDKVLAPTTIEKISFNALKNVQEFNWTLLQDANNYAINIVDGSTVVFGSALQGNTVKSYSISASGAGWATGFTPEVGKTYKVRIYAFLYEPNGDGYNVQATSIQEQSFEWGKAVN